MTYSDETYDLRIETDWGQYRITPAESAKMDTDLDTLRKLVADFPVSDLKIEIKKQSSGRIHVGTSLRLPARTLFTADEDVQMHPAWDRCIRKLIHKVTAYKEKLANKPTYSKEIQGTVHNVSPTMDPAMEDVERAAHELDYPAFRQALGVYEGSLEARVGRWVERYPVVARRLGDGLAISEIVEEVYLNAFERYGERPPLRLGEWLEGLIDPSVRMLAEDRAGEKENLSFIQTAKEVNGGV
jgi:ribosome-associated translation inhibitor RaiA